MTASEVASHAQAEVPPPPRLRAMWRLLRLGYQHEPGLLVYAVVVTILNAIPDALLALWLMLLADGVADGDDRQVLLSALGIAGSVTWTWVFNVFSTRIQRRFRDRVTIALETHVARLQATIGTVESRLGFTRAARSSGSSSSSPSGSTVRCPEAVQ